MYELPQKIFNQALNLVSSHDYSEQQLRNYLADEFADIQNIDEHIEKIIANLERLNFVDDARLARNLAEKSVTKGNRFIRQALQAKLIPGSLIDAAIAQLLPESERAKSEALRYCPCINQHSLGERQKKLLAHLLSLEFSEEVCLHVVKLH